MIVSAGSKNAHGPLHLCDPVSSSNAPWGARPSLQPAPDFCSSPALVVEVKQPHPAGGADTAVLQSHDTGAEQVLAKPEGATAREAVTASLEVHGEVEWHLIRFLAGGCYPAKYISTTAAAPNYR